MATFFIAVTMRCIAVAVASGPLSDTFLMTLAAPPPSSAPTLLSSSSSSASSITQSFVSVRHTQLWRNGKPYYFIGANYWQCAFLDKDTVTRVRR